MLIYDRTNTAPHAAVIAVVLKINPIDEGQGVRAAEGHDAATPCGVATGCTTPIEADRADGAERTVVGKEIARCRQKNRVTGSFICEFYAG